MHFGRISFSVWLPKEMTLVQPLQLPLPDCLKSEPIHRCQQFVRGQKCQQNLFHESQWLGGEGSWSVQEKGHGETEGKVAVRAYKASPYHTRVNIQKMVKHNTKPALDQNLNLTRCKSARGQKSTGNRFS